MSIQLNLSEKQILSALRSFLLNVTNNTMEVVRAQSNKVSPPAGNNYIVITPLFKERLRTNVPTYLDCVFNASIANTTMTVGAMGHGVIRIGAIITGDNIAPNTSIISQASGVPGGIGDYVISTPHTLALQVVAAGSEDIEQAAKLTVQIDCYGPLSADAAHAITTLLRDEYGVELFQSTGFDVVPLHADDAHQAPFLDGEQQIEMRWIITAVLQCNQIVNVPLTFADELQSGIISVDTTYPI